jgi:hypothetical protein
MNFYISNKSNLIFTDALCQGIPVQISHTLIYHQVSSSGISSLYFSYVRGI